MLPKQRCAMILVSTALWSTVYLSCIKGGGGVFVLCYGGWCICPVSRMGVGGYLSCVMGDGVFVLSVGEWYICPVSWGCICPVSWGMAYLSCVMGIVYCPVSWGWCICPVSWGMVYLSCVMRDGVFVLCHTLVLCCRRASRERPTEEWSASCWRGAGSTCPRPRPGVAMTSRGRNPAPSVPVCSWA